MTGTSSTMICLAAVAIAIRPDEHWRSMLMPATSTGQAGGDRALARDVEALGALLHGAAHDHVVDLAGFDAGALDRLADRDAAAMRRRLEVVEGAAIGLADRRAGGGDDDGFAHFD